MNSLATRIISTKVYLILVDSLIEFVKVLEEKISVIKIESDIDRVCNECAVIKKLERLDKNMTFVLN